ncbi:carbon-nitrogen family hydrolase [Pullulanibacillus pueri]|nr:carbon-nitrogen family hydrolase [Pullulanibacillus pueri]
MKLALIQFDIVFGKPKDNYSKVEHLIEKAMIEQPDVIVLPEMWTTGYDLSRLDAIADKEGMETKKQMAALAHHYSVHIVAGSIAQQSQGKVYNTSFAFNREGKCISEYQKVHLFRLMDEEKFLHAGDQKEVFTLEAMPSATVICYDIRFPEWIRTHMLAGAHCLFVPAEWPTPRIEHWRTLLLSRAIENQAFVVACNRVGSDPKNAFGGHSMVIDPWGDILAEAGDQEEILFATIDPERVKEIRQTIPIYEDRRPDLYE